MMLVAGSFAFAAVASAGTQGALTRDQWWYLGGTALDDLLLSESYYMTPTRTGDHASSELPVNYGSTYGQRLRGHVTAPVTGEYTFWIAGDDTVRLSLSPTTSKFDKQTIAELSKHSGSRQWDVFPQGQQSEPVSLVAGQRYYVELLHKEHYGNDSAAFAWSYSDTPLTNWAGDGAAVATQGSTGWGGTADRAIDGNRDGNFWNGSVSHTNTSNLADAWWQVDLGQERLIDRVVIWNRTDNYTNQLSNYRVSVLDGNGAVVASQDFHAESGYTGAREHWELGTAVTGSVVRVEMLGANRRGNYHLSMAEVEVFGRESSIGTYVGRSLVDPSHFETYDPDPNDLDGDELRDDWEIANGFDPAVAQGGDFSGAADPDKDTLTNYEESLQGTLAFEGNSIPGYFTYERWDNHFAFDVSGLIEDDVFYQEPALRFRYDQNRFFGIKDATGWRIRGYVTAPESGEYQFWLSTNNASHLWISSDETKYRKSLYAMLGAEVGTGHGIHRDSSALWDTYASQMSGPIQMEAGQRYFIEVLSSQPYDGACHISLAWARPGQDREPLDMQFVSSYAVEPADADDDYLPDTWEQQYGLSVIDNGLTDRLREGEWGDYDADGLTNREEYLAGTNPTKADSDNDGISDADELRAYGSDPLVNDAAVETLAATIDLPTFTSSDFAWSEVNGSLVSDTFRGAISWDFNVTEGGMHIINAATTLAGSLRVREEIDVEVKIDGKQVRRQRLVYGSDHKALLRAITPHLDPGAHTLEIYIDNYIARRTIMIDSIEVRKAGGVDANNDGVADWLASELAEVDFVLPHGAASAVSPVTLEGSAAVRDGMTVNQIDVTPGADRSHWVYNLDLDPTGAVTPYSVGYTSGLVDTGELYWSETNVLNGGSLTVRTGDSLLLTAALADGSGTATITAENATYALTGNATQIHTFNNPGEVTVTATHSDGSTGTLTVTVRHANLPDNTSVAQNVVNHVQLADADVDRNLAFSGGAGLVVGDVESVDSNHFRLKLTPEWGGGYGIMARLWPDGPLADIGDVAAIGVSDALQNELSVSQPAPGMPGYSILTTPMVVSDLPEGGYVKVTIFRSGLTFLDGSTVMTISADQIDKGLYLLKFLVPEGMEGGYCHYIDIYGADGEYLGRR
ncbi:PA14 domain-containing protein [Sulfuriroseicoccus oceanibius]|uniref:Discoidin domain-containing protein n=1 Tax=Sulfuriroseicoccus oceanibius TaxID=2707525 RepID=A0A6B3L9Z9_9BACT|nr:PA14 domain-containing protein [Sulfuriroseicoccus oceanibius]QQL43724.1 discoidin domain-containing protein [Sulfuriroseicoccus oceanibius]